MTNHIYTAIGLMSGTSCDGVDVALVKTDGRRHLELGPGMTVPYSDAVRARLLSVGGEAQAFGAKQSLFRQAEQDVTDAHIDAIQQFVKTHHITPRSVDLIGFHGHTVLHRPEEHVSWQIGNGERLAQETGIDVVYDFRSADIAAGGQGAPLAPVFHRAALESAGVDLNEPVAVINIGGVANITYVHQDSLIAFDTGPGNALLDDWVKRHKGQFYDVDGSLAAAGKVNEDVLAQWLEHPYFTSAYPKSLDRNAFNQMVDQLDLSVEDGAATLTQLTVQAVVNALSLLPNAPTHYYVCGGGCYNPTMMQWLQERLCPTTLAATRHVNCMDRLAIGGKPLDPSLVEAYLFGYLGVRSKLELPITFQSTTGTTTSSAIGGVFLLGRWVVRAKMLSRLS